MSRLFRTLLLTLILPAALLACGGNNNPPIPTITIAPPASIPVTEAPITPQPPPPTIPLTPDSLPPESITYALTGKWEIVKYIYGSVASMSNDEAASWLQQTIEIATEGSEPVLFLDNLQCGLTIEQDQDIAAYLDFNYRVLPATVGLADERADLIKSTCEIPGFAEFIHQQDQLLIQIGGVFFVLKPFQLPTAGVAGCTNDAVWLADLSIPPGSMVKPGQTLTKQWQLQNSGTCRWDESYSWQFIGGDQLAGPDSLAINGAVEADFFYDVWVDLIAPTTPGIYRGMWQLHDAAGEPFGPQLDYLIRVQE